MPAQEAIDLRYAAGEAAHDEETRTRRLKNAYLDSKPAICMERALAFTRSYKETEGQATPVRLAKAFRLACETITLNIFISCLSHMLHCRFEVLLQLVSDRIYLKSWFHFTF